MKKYVNGVEVDMTKNEIAEFQTEMKALAVKEAELEVIKQRTERNMLLAETDWTASSDVTMSDAMTAYRQALRDVPAQSGFPTDINWPEFTGLPLAPVEEETTEETIEETKKSE